jgi:hypothetical protein
MTDRAGVPLRRCCLSRGCEESLYTLERFFTAYAANERDGIASVLAKRGIDEVLAFFAALDSVGFKAQTFFLQAGDDYVVDIHPGYSTGGDGKVDTTWALVWHLDAAGKVDRVVNLSGDQHQMDASSGRTSRSSRYRSGL